MFRFLSRRSPTLVTASRACPSSLLSSSFSSLLSSISSSSPSPPSLSLQLPSPSASVPSSLATVSSHFHSTVDSLHSSVSRRPCAWTPSTERRRSYSSSNTSNSSSPSSTYNAEGDPMYSYPYNASGRSVIMKQIREYAKKKVAKRTLREYIEIGTGVTPEGLIKNCQLLYDDLPILLAKRIKELESLPYGLSSTPPVLQVRGWYEESFRDILSVNRPQTNEAEQAFSDLLSVMLDRHKDVVPTLARGLLIIKKDMNWGSSGIDCPYLTDFLDRFYMSRIDLRMTISHHVALRYQRKDYCGVINLVLSPVDVVEQAASDAKRICERAYGNAPDVNVVLEGDSTWNVPTVPANLHHMLFELLKNSMRAVVETHGVDNFDLPEIDIICVSSDREFTIKISDQGGGISRKHMKRIWSYLHTTAPAAVQEKLLSSATGAGSMTGGQNSGLKEAPMAGFGYGLPLSRLFARYLGGDLQVISMHGYGTDAYVYLNKPVLEQDNDAV